MTDDVLKAMLKTYGDMIELNTTLLGQLKDILKVLEKIACKQEGCGQCLSDIKRISEEITKAISGIKSGNVEHCLKMNEVTREVKDLVEDLAEKQKEMEDSEESVREEVKGVGDQVAAVLGKVSEVGNKVDTGGLKIEGDNKVVKYVLGTLILSILGFCSVQFSYLWDALKIIKEIAEKLGLGG